MAKHERHATDELIGALQDTALYDHPVRNFSVIETHISWIILTGLFAYKIKKPSNLGFLDFSTLDRRKFYCEEELRLNRRFAPALYIDVITITGSRRQPQFNGDGQVIEYAVRMREFPQSGLLSTLAAEQRLQSTHVDAIAGELAGFHARAQPACANSEFGSCASFLKWSRENFDHIHAAVPSHLLPDGFNTLKKWSLSPAPSLQRIIDQRRDHGCVRECHGDLHLGNIALINDRVTLFDCIEFNEELRWIDTMNESAFLTMDLQARGYPRYAWRFINEYLQAGGDYQGIALLRHYLVYRALVRAKVEALSARQQPMADDCDSGLYREALSYIDLAMDAARYNRPALIIMHGLSGSGKSTLAKQLVETIGAIQIRSDIERKRLFGLQAQENTDSAISAGIYSEAASVATYNRLAELCVDVTNAGYTVIVDAAFLESKRRAQFRKLALQHDIPFILVSCRAPADVLRERITQRSKHGCDPSEASVDILEHQLRTHDPLSADEQANSFTTSESATQLAPGQLRSIELRITQHRT